MTEAYDSPSPNGNVTQRLQKCAIRAQGITRAVVTSAIMIMPGPRHNQQGACNQSQCDVFQVTQKKIGQSRCEKRLGSDQGIHYGHRTAFQGFKQRHQRDGAEYSGGYEKPMSGAGGLKQIAPPAGQGREQQGRKGGRLIDGECFQDRH